MIYINTNIYPKVSNRNSKLGHFICTTNLPVGITCRKDAPCLNEGCYGKRGNFNFKNIKKCYVNNLDVYQKSPQEYFDVLYKKISLFGVRYFRYFSVGDIVDDEYFKRMCVLATKTENTEFLCFTKKFEIVNTYLSEGNTIPENLTTVFSNWGNFVCENPYKLPSAYVRFKDKENKIPQNAMQCNGYCGKCVQDKNSCWDLTLGESVVFDKH